MSTGIPNMSNSPEYNILKDVKVTLNYDGKLTCKQVLNFPYTKSFIVDNFNAIDSNSIKNTLYYGENIEVMLELLHDKKLGGKIKLIYIDPPFSTKCTFNSKNHNHAYSDVLSGGQYIESIRERLIILKELLSDDGSIYVHLDNKMIFHIKIIMDELFGDKNFRGFITRKKCSNKNSTKKTYGNISDYILFYTKSDKYTWNRPYDSWAEESMLREYPCVDEITGQRYKKVPIHAPGIRNGETGKEWRGMLPPQGKHWQYTPTKLDELDRNGEIYWSSNGNPRRKIYFSNSEGIPVQDIWLNYRDSINQNVKTTGYPTEKNIDMLKLIVGASSSEGDIVLDCYCGSGTTLGASYELNRNWIGIDNSLEAIKAVYKRFLHGLEMYGDYVGRNNENVQHTIPLINNSLCQFELRTNEDNVDELREILESAQF